MKKIGISDRIRERVEEIYERTQCVVRINDMIVGRFEYKRGVRQGCPLSPKLFNIALADIEEKLETAQEGGVLIGKVKIRSISYADYITLLANNATGMRELLREFKKFILDLGLSLNTKKTKLLIFKKGRNKREKETWRYDKEELEEVNRFNYLGYTLSKRNGDDVHVKERTRIARAALGRVWSLGEYLANNDWKTRIKLFDAIIGGIISYGAEIWGWQDKKNVETIQDRFIKWSSGLRMNTPRDILKAETGRRDLKLRFLKRALMFELKIKKAKEKGDLLGNCDWRRNRGENMTKKFIKEELQRIGWSKESIETCWSKGFQMWEELAEAHLGKEKADKEKSLEESTFAIEIKEILKFEKGKEYLDIDKEKRRNAMKIFARFRLGSENKTVEYWKNEEEKKCRLCGKDQETLKHIIEDCPVSGNKNRNWKEVLNGSKKEDLAILAKIQWLRKRKKEEEEMRNKTQS